MIFRPCFFYFFSKLGWVVGFQKFGKFQTFFFWTASLSFIVELWLSKGNTALITKVDKRIHQLYIDTSEVNMIG